MFESKIIHLQHGRYLNRFVKRNPAVLLACGNIYADFYITAKASPNQRLYNIITKPRW